MFGKVVFTRVLQPLRHFMAASEEVTHRRNRAKEGFWWGEPVAQKRAQNMLGADVQSHPPTFPHQPGAWGPKTLNPMMGRLAGEGLLLKRGLSQAQVAIAPYTAGTEPPSLATASGREAGAAETGAAAFAAEKQAGRLGGWGGGWTCLTEPRLE